MSDDFKAMAVRAALSIHSDGVVFGEESRDTLDQRWEELSDSTRNSWRELAETLHYMLSNNSGFKTISKSQGDNRNDRNDCDER